MKKSIVKALTESAIMIAMATVLSLVKIIDLPYGGSVTPASMLPIVVIAYRHGTKWGLSAGLVFGIIQQLLGLNVLSFAPDWKSVIAIIVIDYIFAYTVIGFAGIFRKTAMQTHALTFGALLTAFLRYICHVISGATVWAGLSIPTEAALSFSFIYNATYMIPETIVLCVAALYVGSCIGFSSSMPIRLRRGNNHGAWMSLLAGGLLCAAVIYDTVAVFSHLQDGETGEFTIENIKNIQYSEMLLITAGAALLAALLLILKKRMASRSEKQGEPK